MKRNQFRTGTSNLFRSLHLSLWFLFGTMAYGSPVLFQDTLQRPNIIFIMTDDHAFQAISTYGSDLIKTPAIDRLAEEGMRFDRAFVTNSICSPSRAVILTGKFSHLNGVMDNQNVFDSSQVTFPKILQQHQYHTALIGKWHLKSIPTGFDYWKILQDQGAYYHPEFITPDGLQKEKGYATDIITDLALSYLDTIRPASQPFMLMVHHKAPHREWWPSIEHLASFHKERIPEPSTLFDDYSHRGFAAKEAEMRIADHMALSMDNKINPSILKDHHITEFLNWYENTYLQTYERLSPAEKEQWDAVYDPINEEFAKQNLKGDELTRWKYKRFMEDYLACVQSVDENIGRLLHYLDTSGLAQNTLVIYTSDQGFYLGEHGWFDKRFMYEPSFRTPLLMRWPGVIPPGTTNDMLVQNIDYAPTILDAASIKPSNEMQGKSIVPLMKQHRPGWRNALYYHYYEYPGIHMVKRHYGIRTEQYKLIHFYNDVDEWELYDLQKDPDEMNNLYGNDTYHQIQKKLHRRLKKLQEQYSDPIME